MSVNACARRAWRTLTWRHWAWATAIPVLVAVSMPLQVFGSNRYWAFWQMLFNIPWYLFIAYLFLAAVVLAESFAIVGDAVGMRRYVAAMAVASVVCVGVAGLLWDRFPQPPKTVEAGQVLAPRSDLSPAEREARNRTHIMFRTLTPLLFGWLATFVYINLRRSRRSMRLLEEAQIGRSEAQQALFAAQLAAAHAQVDPALVFRKLEDIEKSYDADPVKAGEELDDLIAFLRAAIPRLRSEEASGRFVPVPAAAP